MADREREERIAQAIALRESGQTFRQVSEATGLAPSRVHDHYHRWLRSDDPESRRRRESELVAQHYEIAMLASSELRRRLADPEAVQAMSAKDLYTAGGISLDKLAKYQRWGAADAGQGGGAMDQLLQRIEERGGTFSLRVERHHEPGATDAASGATVDVEATERQGSGEPS